MVKISVIVPVYNVEKYLGQCLDSVLCQNFEEYEIICVEDASTDASLNILSDYKSKSEKIKVIVNNENQGLSCARNQGILMAGGKYILFLDSDDYLAPDALKRMFAEAESREVEVVTFSSQNVYENGENENKFSGMRNKCYPENMDGVTCYLRQLENQEYKCTVWQYFYRRDFLERYDLRFIENAFHEDVSYTFLVHMYAESMVVMKDVLHYYRIRDNSIMTGCSMAKRTRDLFYNYLKCVEYALTLSGDALLKSIACEKQLSSIKSIIDLYFRKCNAGEKRECLEGLSQVQKIFFDHITGYKNRISLSEDEVEFLRTHDKIYVYGAGKYAQKIIFELIQNEISVSGILVSSMEKNPDFLLGYKLHLYSEVKNRLEGALVIPGVSFKYLGEVMDILCENDKIKIFNIKVGYGE